MYNGAVNASTIFPQPERGSLLDRRFSRDNGFQSLREMRDQHRPVLRAVRRELTRAHCLATVLDLGCGNGALLRRIVEAKRNVTAHGVDESLAVLKRAKYLGGARLQFTQADLWNLGSFSVETNFTVATIMAGFLVAGPRQSLLSWIKDNVATVVAYTYADDFARFSVLISRTPWLCSARMRSVEFNAASSRTRVWSFSTRSVPDSL